MNKKNIMLTLGILSALSSISFSAGETTNIQAQNINPRREVRKTISAEDKKLYDTIYGKYEDKFNKLDVNLLENNQELRKQLRQEKVDWKKVENLTKKKSDYKAQKELLSYQLRDELKSNNLRPMMNRGNKSQGPNRGHMKPRG